MFLSAYVDVQKRMERRRGREGGSERDRQTEGETERGRQIESGTDKERYRDREYLIWTLVPHLLAVKRMKLIDQKTIRSIGRRFQEANYFPAGKRKN